MNTRKLSSCLIFVSGLLLHALAGAAEFGIDTAGNAAVLESNDRSVPAHADCPPPASAPNPRQRLDTSDLGVSSDSTDAAAAGSLAARDSSAMQGDSATRSGSSTGALNVPAKIRSNRWQSLVPGAIK